MPVQTCRLGGTPGPAGGERSAPGILLLIEAPLGFGAISKQMALRLSNLQDAALEEARPGLGGAVWSLGTLCPLELGS